MAGKSLKRQALSLCFSLRIRRSVMHGIGQVFPRARFKFSIQAAIDSSNDLQVTSPYALINITS